MKMTQQTDHKIILITRQTRLDNLITRFNTQEQARFYIESLGADFSDYQAEHENYYQTVKAAENDLKSIGRVQVLDRYFLANFIFGSQDIIVVLGQDGLVANTMKYLDGQPVIGVNPDPKRFDGVLLPFEAKDLLKVGSEVAAGSRQKQEVSMAKAALSDGQELFAVNDLFIGPKTHSSIMYIIEFGKIREQQSSSGIIISTGLGSTGWLKSLVTGAEAIISSLSKKKIDFTDPTGFAWESEQLYFTVREPFPSQISTTSLVFGKIEHQKSLTVESMMPENGVIFSDGQEGDFLTFNSGTRAKITIGEKKGVIII
jgi:NAD kinase